MNKFKYIIVCLIILVMRVNSFPDYRLGIDVIGLDGTLFIANKMGNILYYETLKENSKRIRYSVAILNKEDADVFSSVKSRSTGPCISFSQVNNIRRNIDAFFDYGVGLFMVNNHYEDFWMTKKDENKVLPYVLAKVRIQLFDSNNLSVGGGIGWTVPRKLDTELV